MFLIWGFLSIYTYSCEQQQAMYNIIKISPVRWMRLKKVQQQHTKARGWRGGAKQEESIWKLQFALVGNNFMASPHYGHQQHERKAQPSGALRGDMDRTDSTRRWTYIHLSIIRELLVDGGASPGRLDLPLTKTISFSLPWSCGVDSGRGNVCPEKEYI